MSDPTPNLDALPDSLPICIDMALPADRQHGALGAALHEKLWPGRPAVVRVGFLDGQPAWHDTVRQHAVTWCQYAAVQFTFTAEPAFARKADIRISFGQPCNWSYIGTDAKDADERQPTLVLGSVADARLAGGPRRYVLHEFGHALGLVHEHQTSNYRWVDDQGIEQVGIPWDEAAVVEFCRKSYGWNADQAVHNMIQRYSGAQLRGETFDRDSIMIYAIDPHLTRRRLAVGWPNDLSAGDKAFIAELYPKHT